MKLGILAVLASLAFGCGGGVVIEPGHRALRFDPKNGGLQHQVLYPGYQRLSCGIFQSVCPRLDDFVVTYLTKQEDLAMTSAEGLTMKVRVAIVFRPIIAELYQLDTEIGPRYYDEVVGPETRSAARGVLARHSYLDVQKNNEKIEGEIEAEVRRRCAGKHVEISSAIIEAVSYAPEIEAAVKARIAAQQEAERAKAVLEAAATRRRAELEALAAPRTRGADEGADVIRACMRRLAKDLADETPKP